jgi:hypothetical protein
VALAVERLAGRDCRRFCFGRMQAVMPRSARAARDGLLSSPRSAISPRAGGSSGTRMFAPFWSFICPAESIMTTGRPWPAQTAASFAFCPPWGAAEAAIWCPLLRRLAALQCALSWVLSMLSRSGAPASPASAAKIWLKRARRLERTKGVQRVLRGP